MALIVGEVLSGIVKNIVKFGLFVQLPDDSVGLVHISEVADQYISDLNKLFERGQSVKVKVLGIDGEKIALSIKQVANASGKSKIDLLDKNKEFDEALDDFLNSTTTRLDHLDREINNDDDKY